MCSDAASQGPETDPIIADYGSAADPAGDVRVSEVFIGAGKRIRQSGLLVRPAPIGIADGHRQHEMKGKQA